jgi:hypothetical protein
MAESGGGIDWRTAQSLQVSAEVFGDLGLARAAQQLSDVAEILPDVIDQLNSAAKPLMEY